MHAKYFKNLDTNLSSQLDGAARRLYSELLKLYLSHNGAYFCYDEHFNPVCSDDPSGSTRQVREPGIFTYSDLFVIKGLIAAAVRFAPENLFVHLEALQQVVESIMNDRFILMESGHLTESTLSKQESDYGPMMIAMGAASLLHRLNLAEHDSFSAMFTNRILEDYFDHATGLLANTPGGCECNIGHGIEFAGFVLSIQRMTGSTEQLDRLVNVITAAYRAGFDGKGLRLSVSLPSLHPVKPVCPWWSLPETIQAVSLGYEITHCQELMAIWQSAHNAFFERYWRYDPPISYQTMTSEGPIDYVPATPDLDPAYHTGLSLLTAIEMTERYIQAQKPH